MYKYCIVFIVVYAVVLNFANDSCSWTDPTTGLQFDLSGLRNDQSDYIIHDLNNTKHDVYYAVNFCRTLVTTVCGNDCAVCQMWDKYYHACLGKESTRMFSYSAATGLVANFYDGDSEYDGSRNISIVLNCDTDVQQGFPVYTGEHPWLVYNFNWTTRYACHTGYECNNKDCRDCTAESKCTYCLDNSACIMKSNLTSCDNWLTSDSFCPRESSVCSKFTSCNQCTKAHGKCTWCLDDNKCILKTNKESQCGNIINNRNFCSL